MESLRVDRETWDTSPVLRSQYRCWHERLRRWLPKQGRGVLELGSGVGGLNDSFESILLSDAAFVPWLDIVCRGEALPLKGRMLEAVVLIDVLHHVSNPGALFSEAERVLKIGGYICILDMFISPFSHLFLKPFHHEPVAPRRASLHEENMPEGNQALATALFFTKRGVGDFHSSFPNIDIIHRERFSTFLYPLVGGFAYRSWISKKTFLKLLPFDDFLARKIGRLLAWRCLVVLEIGEPR